MIKYNLRKRNTELKLEVRVMDHKFIGTILCLISALLMCARYLSAAIFMSGVSGKSSELFSRGLDYVGLPLKTASIVSLAVGILLLIYGLYQDRRKDKSSN